MFKGLNTATSGMIAQQRRQDALSHNLANMNTPGFKKDQAMLRSFPEMLTHRIENGQQGLPGAPRQASQIGSLATGVYAQEHIPLFDTGDIIETEKPHDFAIADYALAPNQIDGRAVKPAIFFAVQTRAGELEYTRNGNFTVDALGQLVTSDGSRVLDTQGNPLFIGEDGRVQATELGLVRIENPHDLIRSGSDRYRYEGDNPPGLLPPGVADGFSVRNGFIERANVDPGQTITDMMVTMRAYESNQKVIQSYDRTMELLNSIGRLG
ncbi:hypothetical protein BEP19_07380 [Ammoniphilus oxalaticus]|uniref:Uncharacterized protein n=1 Tax=Ammoniphilus oxalaticus TaxID=66863 RepID=A0A419SJZ4_9BACL|nr:flagellar hook-basal body protein [Ammoniphilus oxalaticus]RKD24218.1 hypothetical protein BEP19_07380 [Ammoniphilus oxalaticus]